jgi:hypothetical protein
LRQQARQGSKDMWQIIRAGWNDIWRQMYSYLAKLKEKMFLTSILGNEKQMRKTEARNFMLGWLCIMNYMCNNQLDAPFILSLLNYHISTCFGQEVECIYVANGTCFTSKLTVSRPADSQLYSIIVQFALYILPPNDGLLIRPIHVGVSS